MLQDRTTVFDPQKLYPTLFNSIVMISKSIHIWKFRSSIITFLSGVLLCSASCDDPVQKSVLKVTTTEASDITRSSAQVNGEVTALGKPIITARGICWATTTNPTVSDNTNTAGNGIGNFTSTLTALPTNTTYYARAYAVTKTGCVYGNEISFSTLPDVYVSGKVDNSVMYWKNGEAVKLSDGINYASGNSIFVSGNDVYVAGFETVRSYLVAKYWKNGVGVSLSDGSHDASANAIVVAKNDVYVAGYENNNADFNFVAKYWMNGVGVELMKSSNESRAVSIYVSGTDIYVAGYEIDGGKPVATYWKNGVAVRLSGASNSEANSIYVSGDDVYVAGAEYGEAKYWKNGEAVSLSVLSSEATSIFVSGSDVYVAGTEFPIRNFPVAKYWKNGVGISLSNGRYYAEALSIVAVKNDVYVAGFEKKEGYSFVAKYWKNGAPMDLTDGTANGMATGLFLK
jgi:hypothetical protein